MQGYFINKEGLKILHRYIPKYEEKIISEADMYVTNRDMKTLSRVAFADRYDVSIVSGVDIPMFR